ncbi:TIGR02530 family flagellar biosynthesis protein [Desulforamulus aquiferis]|uniref:TIGR02530 family flagellar biosynthesis protein n=1 Tax=Desulforamulus aquiferis TaxID=1397668 RepID=A0AAW7ZF83_9FIRM|nr:TIGR02530 family flagellar biosynthesis protein [Desulforamulus aquiferis]MDO7788372.1 TIGR02530 family flagellar biosynthesis protein [Desulforamulus aquiferis]
MKTQQEAHNQVQKVNQPQRVLFEEYLQREVNRQSEVKLSAHAEKRLKERNVSLSEDDFNKINKAVQRAAAKGSRDSLLLYGDLALVTSITNRTVVTAIDGKNMEQHVFTNIDSAVIIK